MGIYLKGMEMPRNCTSCVLAAPINVYTFDSVCKITRKGCAEIGRNEDCPLTEVPKPHGRLIDMDKALEVIALEYGYDGIEDDMEYKVPTVIESEVEE